MKTGKTLFELATALTEQAESKRDFIVPAAAAAMVVDGNGHREVHFEDKQYSMTSHFETQLSTALEIPKKYYDRMAVESPQLLCRNVNEWLGRSSDKRLVRTMTGKARAYLSERYRPLDNYDLAEVALPILKKIDARVESCEITDTHFYLKAVTERVKGELAVGDAVQAGICISNSEVGCSSLKIEPLIFRLRCLNGMIMPDAAMRKYHVGRGARFDFEGAQEFYRDETRRADDKALWLKVRDTLEASFIAINFAQMVDKFKAAKEDRIISDPLRVVELAAKKFSWSEQEGMGVLAHLMSGGDMNRFGLINAITRHAQDLESYDRSTEFERIGGQVLELPRNAWETIAVQ